MSWTPILNIFPSTLHILIMLPQGQTQDNTGRFPSSDLVSQIVDWGQNFVVTA